MENMTEYQKNLVRMWDSIRTDDQYKGKLTCRGTVCVECPLDEVCSTDVTFPGRLRNAEKAIEIVTRWAKEHPIITRAEKYKETFGVEPRRKNGRLICPLDAGFLDFECTNYNDCGSCRNEFWNSAYVEKTGGDA